MNDDELLLILYFINKCKRENVINEELKDKLKEVAEFYLKNGAY